MKKIEIAIGGKAYPCQETMGAWVRFKEQTGRDITEMNFRSLSDICVYLWCCIVSACKREGVDFKMSFMEFADSVAPEEMQKWTDSMAERQNGTQEAEEGSEKKSPQPSVSC